MEQDLETARITIIERKNISLGVGHFADQYVFAAQHSAAEGLVNDKESLTKKLTSWSEVPKAQEGITKLPIAKRQEQFARRNVLYDHLSRGQLSPRALDGFAVPAGRDVFVPCVCQRRKAISR